MLAAGLLVAFPTETVYGLGADATNPEAVARLYAAKGRPSFNPLIAHVATIEEALALGTFDVNALKLAKCFWPGPLTLVVPARPDGPVCDLARAGLDSIAIRVPDHPLASELLKAAGRPIAAPSANRSGHVSPSEASHVLTDLDGRIEAVLDGGPTSVGLESTIIGCLDGQVTMLRPGAITRTMVSNLLSFAPDDPAPETGDAPRAPGRLASHYAPRAKLILNSTDVPEGAVCLGFGPHLPAGADRDKSLNLSVKSDLLEAAANLYGHMRKLDSGNADVIYVSPLPHAELGEAIGDRLIRASAPRSE